jgi:PDZ domain/PEGA domain
MKHVSLRILTAALLLGVTAFAPLAWAQADVAEAQIQLAEARRHFDALEYEQAVPALDRVIALLSTRPTAGTRQMLAIAYEVRARARFGLRDQAGARSDFVALLRVDASYALTGQVSPQVVTLFDETRRATVTSVKLTITPPNAEVLLDGAPVNASTGTIPVLIGEHTISGRRVGFRPATQTFSATGDGGAVSLTLDRDSAVVAVITSPADSEVFIDGVSHGKTLAGPPSAEYSQVVAKAGIPVASLSAALVIADVTNGVHRIEVRRPCYSTVSRTLDVTQLGDFIMEPMKLDSAMATLVARSTMAGTTVYVDGQQRGAAPHTMDVCEGEHTVDLRSAAGRFSKKVDARPGQNIEVVGTPKPAFALVSTSGTSSLNTDIRAAVERAFESVQSIAVFAPPNERVDSVLRAEKLPREWLAFDANKRPLGASSEINAATRKEASARLARAFEAQGVGAVAIPSAANPSRVVVSLLGAGSGDPDVIELSLDRPDTIANAVAQLNRTITFGQASIGITTIDVADVPGPIVLNVSAKGPASQAGIQPGDIVVKANGQDVATSSALIALLNARAANDSVSLELKDKAGAAKKADVKVLITPRVIGMGDQTLLANRIVVDLRNRLASSPSAADEPVIRLNLAAALIRLESWGEAQAELQRVQLPDGPGVGKGTVQYLLGLCADKLGSRADAETALKAAAASDNLLTENGPAVKELAEAKLAELQRRASQQ